MTKESASLDSWTNHPRGLCTRTTETRQETFILVVLVDVPCECWISSAIMPCFIGGYTHFAGDGPPSLFWPTNGIIIMFLTSSPSMMDFLLATVAGMFGLAMAQFDDVRRSVAFQLAGANA